MKNKLILYFSFISFIAVIQQQIYSQCVTCPGNIVTGINSSALGHGDTVTANYSFAAGRNSQISSTPGSISHYSNIIGSWSRVQNGGHANVIGSFSQALNDFAIVFGTYSKAKGSYSFALGTHVEAWSGSSFVIGEGMMGAKLINTIPNSLMIGIGSALPTLFVEKAPYSSESNRTGRIGIGNITAPQAKLHIRADAVEDATLLLEAQGSKSSIFTLTGQTGNIVFSGGAGNIGVARYRNPLNFYTADQQNNPRLSMTIEGERWFVGIGTATPETRLEIKHSSGENALRIRRNEKIYDFRISDSDHLQIRDRDNTRLTIRSNGEIKTESNLIVEGSLLSEKLSGHFLIYAGTGENEGARILMQPVNTAKNMKGSLKFYTPADGWIEFHQGGQQVMNIREDKNIYVGWHDNESDIYVRGEVHAKKFRATYTPWPDYVFDPLYKLPQLDEVENFIHTHRHLPGIPSAQTVEKEGIELAEMNALLLKKIEELTLYVIEQQKQINALNQRFAETE